jgi:uncharacterized protein (TIGR03067 family)
MNARCLLVLVAAVLVAADDPKKDIQNMQGTWTIESIEKDGKEIDKAELKNRKVIIQSNKYTVKEGDKVIDQGTYKLDASKSPKQIDISPTAGQYTGKTLLGIYQLEDDDRAICFSTPGLARPTVFTTKPDSGQVFIMYKRAKK